MIEARVPPGPKALLPINLLFDFRRNPLQFLESMTVEFGDTAYLNAAGRQIYFFNNPEIAQDVFIKHHHSFRKGLALQRTKALLGEGLLTSEGSHHLRQRRMIQPMFHRQRIAGYADTMVSMAEPVMSSWQDGAVLDIHAEMTRLTLLIVAKSLFDVDVENDADEIGQMVTTLVTSFLGTLGPLAELRLRLPLPSSKRILAARARLETAIQAMITERRAEGDRGDLLSMLIAAQDDENADYRMGDRQVREEALTLFLAGHETTANALTWTFYLLAQNPEATRRLHEELDRVLAGRNPTYADLECLPYTRMVLSESMRLYPPAWIVTREAIEDIQVGEYCLRKGATVLLSQWVVHRDERYYPDALKFDPGRWTPDQIAARPKMTYFPFGAGPRICIAEPFAWMEGTLLLAAIAQKWDMRLEPGFAVELLAQITLRPKHGMQMMLKQRVPPHQELFAA
jgi:cytochrome P450